MDKALNYVAWGLIAPFYWTHLARRSLSDRSTNNYLDSLSETSLLSAFSQALRPLTRDSNHVDQIFEKFAAANDQHNKVMWNEDSFGHFIQAASGGALHESLTKPLWCCFSRAAYFPLNPPCARNLPWKTEVDLDAFRRAVALLAVQGIQLPGFDVHWTGGQIPHSLKKKIPTISRFIISCMASTDPGQTEQESDDEDEKEKPVEETSSVEEEDLTMNNVLDTVCATQPPAYLEPFGDLTNVPGVPRSAFREAAERLVLSAKTQPNYVPVHAAMQRQDFYALLRSSLMVCICDQRWRDGVSLARDLDQISADVQQCRLEDDGFMAEELATSLMGWCFPESEGNGREISYASFNSFCNDCPTFLLLFSHLWTSLFIPHPSKPPARPALHSTIPTTLVNTLSLLNICNLDSHLPTSDRHFATELQTNLDFQAATQIFTTFSAENQEDLQTVLSSTSASNFHILIIHAEKTLLAIFLAPPDPTMEIWRARDGADYGYTWRYSWVDLIPSVRVMETGAMSVSEESQDGILTLKARPGDEKVTIDMHDRTLSRSGEVLQWTTLKCYRMPGTACPVRKYLSKAKHNQFS